MPLLQLPAQLSAWLTDISAALDRRSAPRLLLLPDHVYECYRVAVWSTWGNSHIVRAEWHHNDDLDKPHPGIILPDFKYHLVVHWLHFYEVSGSAEMELSGIQWACLDALVRAARFWELPKGGGHGGFDGAHWLVEGNREGRYHQVHRWSPSPDEDGEWLVLPCQYLNDLALVAKGKGKAAEQSPQQTGHATNDFIEAQGRSVCLSCSWADRGGPFRVNRSGPSVRESRKVQLATTACLFCSCTETLPPSSISRSGQTVR